MKTLFNQFNSQLKKNATSSACSNIISDINTVLQMSQMLDDKSNTDFYCRVMSDLHSFVSVYTKEFADYVTQQNCQEVSDTKTK